MNTLRSLSDFQRLINKIYTVQNDRHFTTLDLVLKLLRYVTKTGKGVRKDRRQEVAMNLTLSFAWTLAIANRLHINLEREVWRRFPSCCPYCGSQPCSCKERSARRREFSVSSGGRPRTIIGYQNMFRKIYPGNTLSTSTTHLFEEVAEVVESVQHFTASHAQEVLENLRIELVDVAANLFAVATCSNISLTDTVRKMFANGCLRCHKRPCRCGFTVSDDDPPFVF